MNNDKNKEIKNFISDAASATTCRIRELNSALNGENSNLRKKIARCAGWAGAAFLLGRASLIFKGGALGLALLCSAPEYVFSVTLGLFAAAVSGGGWFLAAATVATLGIRILMRTVIDPPDGNARISSALFSENAHLRLATSACSAFALEFARMAAGGFYLYDLLGAVTAMVCAPCATVLFFPLFRGNKKLFTDPDDIKTSLLFVASRHALMLSLCLALRDISVFGIKPVHCAVCLCVLFTLRRRGLGEGMIAGLLCGLCAGGTYAILYTVAALAAQSLIRVSPLASSTAVTVCGAIWCAVTRDPSGFIGLFPSQLIGICIFCTADKLFPVKDNVSPEKTSAPSGNTLGATVTTAPTYDRISEISDALGRAADVYGEFSRTETRPGISELRQVCDAACDRVCPDCPERSKCWDDEYAATLDVIAKLCTSVREHGRVTDNAVPDYMKKRCRDIDRICSEVESFASAQLRRKLDESRLDILSDDVRTVSGAISRALADDRAEKEFDPVKAHAVRTVLEDGGIRCGRVSVTGHRCLKIRVAGADLSSSRTGVGELRHRLEVAVGHRLSPVSFVSGDDADGKDILGGGGTAVLEMESRRRFRPVFHAARSGAGTGIEPCGDAICRISTRDGRFFAVICDGMGTGTEAAAAADACCELLRRTLGAGICVESALEMMNSLLRCSENECSVGLDLLSVDLINGEASVWKSGAAPTYIRRNGKIYPITSHSLPAGILKDTDSCRTDFSVAEGDVILMTSDGVSTDSAAVAPILRRVSVAPGGVSGSEVSSGNDAVRRIIRMARDAGSEDDVSAVVIVIAGEPDED